MTGRTLLAASLAAGLMRPMAAQTAAPNPLRNITRTMYTAQTELFA